ncbi:hypothetical protein D3C72_1881750 [compost metagenome]
MVYAAQIGASGCLAVPAPIELVCAAAALVWAGGQCFPRAALAMLRAQPRHAGAAPVSHLHPYPHPHSADGTTATG